MHRRHTLTALPSGGATRRGYWAELLGGGTGRSYWAALLGSATGQRYWAALLGSATGQGYWAASGSAKASCPPLTLRTMSAMVNESR